MRAKKAQPENGGPKVPGYIVTFSDMVTLLLTFFVMLLSLATTQDPELFDVGRDSFVKSVRGMGLGMLFGKDQSIDFDNVKTKHTIENPEDAPNKRTLDAKEERTRRIFNQLKKSATTMPSQLSGERYDFPATDVRFATGSTALDQSAKKSLESLCKKLQRDSDAKSIQLYVLGLTNEGANDRQQWTLSALRAKTVADFVAGIFPEKNRPAIYSWGAGPGRLWTGGKSAIPQNCQIVLAVLRQ